VQSVSHGYRRWPTCICRILLNKSTQMRRYIILSVHDHSFVLCSISIYYLVIMCLPRELCDLRPISVERLIVSGAVNLVHIHRRDLCSAPRPSRRNGFSRATQLCYRGLGSRNSVCPSHACFVTIPRNLPTIFLYHMKGQSF